LNQHKIVVPFHASTQSQVYADAASSGAQEEPSFDLSQIVEFFRREWRVVAVSVLVALILAIIYLFITPPRFTATSVLMLDTRRLQLLQQPAVMGDMSFDAPAVESQLAVLNSETVALSVINKLGLANDPEFTGGGETFLGSIFSAITALGASPEVGTPALPSQQELVQIALKSFKDNLAIKQVGNSYAISISFGSLDAGKASHIANSVGEAYILDQLQAKYAVTKKAATWLQGRIEELRQEAEAADRLALDFRKKNNLADANGKPLSEQQLSDVNTQLILAKVHTAEAKARLDRILDISVRGVENAAVGDSLQNTVLNRLQQEYIEASKRMAEFSLRYGADHLAATNLRREMQQIQEVSKAEINRIAESYKSDYEIARSREQALQTSLDELTRASADTREAQMGLRFLESSANAYRTLYDNFLQRLVEATQQQSLPGTEARLITEAASAEKTRPKTMLVLGIAGILGAALGCTIAFARGQLDHVFRTARQVEQTLGIGCLGVIPEIVNPPACTLRENSLPEAGQRIIAADLGVLRQVVLAPFSRFSETIRTIKVAGDTSPTTRGIKVIGLASALPGEGKSTIASNLAQLMAYSRRRALLIDADLRNSTLSRHIAPQAELGLLEVLDGTVQLCSAVWRDPITGLEFLPTVIKTPIAHTSEILASDPMADFMTSVRDHYEYIVVDFPPLSLAVDVRAAARHMDAFVFTIEWGQTSPQVIFEALGSAEVVHRKLLGAVLNKADATKLAKLEVYKGANYHKYYQSHA
jgi:succinoglycan biosynthesis transport protein ExoP